MRKGTLDVLFLTIFMALGAAILSLPASIVLISQEKIAWSQIFIPIVNSTVAAFVAILVIGLVWLPFQESLFISYSTAAVGVIIQIAIWIGVPVITVHYNCMFIWNWNP